MEEKKCLCQICTCPEKMHKCTYEEGDEALKKASEDHCRRCGCGKKTKPYVPLGPMETSTTYNSEFQPKYFDTVPVRKQPKYDRPGAPMDGTTTYNSDFTNKPPERCNARRQAAYQKPMGDMMLETTYSGEYGEKQSMDKIVSYKPAAYQRPMGPMNFGTTYNSDFTEKPMDSSFVPCCPCCDPKASGYVQQGEENGHLLFVKKGA